MSKLEVGSLVRIMDFGLGAAKACDMGPGWNQIMADELGHMGRVINTAVTPNCFKVDTGQALRAHVWPAACMKPVDWTPKVGDDARTTRDPGYLKRNCSDKSTQEISVKNALLGKRCRVVQGMASSFVIVEYGPLRIWWPIECLIPEAPPAQETQRTLDDVLAGLYDAQKERQDASALLKEYKELTGEDRPGFMK